MEDGIRETFDQLDELVVSLSDRGSSERTRIGRSTLLAEDTR
jgi:hypothetical protein